MIRAVLFDVDGVLVDSREANVVFFSKLLSDFGFRKPSKRKVDMVFGMTLLDGIRFLTKEQSEDRIMRMWTAGQAAKYPFGMLRPTDRNAAKVIRGLGRSYKLGIVTSGVKERAERMVSGTLGVRSMFKVVVGFGDYSRAKHDPESLLAAARRLRVRPGQCAYVGDLPLDMAAAKAAGMKGILYSKMKDSHADAVAGSFSMIASAVYAFDKASHAE